MSARRKSAPAAKSTKPVKKAAARSRSGGTRRKAIGSGRAGAIRKALAAAVDEARSAGVVFTLEDELRVLLAEKHAAMVDDAAAAGDPVGLVRASDKLLEVIDTLPIRKPEGGGAGDGDGPRGRLLRVLDSPPSVGDTADA